MRGAPTGVQPPRPAPPDGTRVLAGTYVVTAAFYSRKKVVATAAVAATTGQAAVHQSPTTDVRGGNIPPAATRPPHPRTAALDVLSPPHAAV